MQGLAKCVRLGAALAVFIALLGLSPFAVGAQPVPESAISQAVPPTSATSDVACDSDVTSTGSADESSSLTGVVQGVAQAVGDVSNVVQTGGEPQTVDGGGIACGEDAPTVADDTTIEQPAGPSPPQDVGAAQTTTEETPVSETASEIEVDGTESEAGVSTESVEAPADGTPVVAPAPATDGTGQPVAEPQAAQTDELEAAALVTIPITAYNCDTAAAAQNPAAECAPAQGIAFDVTVDGQPAPQVVTDFTGTALVDAEEGSRLLIEEVMPTVPKNYVPLVGHQTIDPVAPGASALFVHLLVDGQETGNLQIVNGSCPTSDEEPRTEFNVIGPRTFAGAASSCMPTSGALFTILGDVLPGGQFVVQTGSDGSWRGTLPAGDYTVVDDSGASVALTVEPDSLTVVVVVDYVPQPEGTLTITRVLCTEGDEEATTISVDAGSGAGDACGPSDGSMRLSEGGDGTGGAAEEFSLGDDGQAVFELRTGDYLLTDLASGVSATVTVSENAETAATVREVVLTGRVVVQHIYCDDADYGDVDPANYVAFARGCGRPYANMSLTLSDSGGSVVSSATGSGGGITVWRQLLPGAYSISGGSDVCAIFAERVDARGGFAVAVGNSTNVEVYSCAPPSPPTNGGPDDGTGGNTGGGENAGSGDGTGGGTPAGTGGLYVTQLPDTGVADHARRSVIWLGFLGSTFVLMVAGGAGALRRRID